MWAWAPGYWWEYEVTSHTSAAPDERICIVQGEGINALVVTDDYHVLDDDYYVFTPTYCLKK